MAYSLTIHFTAGDKVYSVQRSGFRIESAVGEQGKHRTQSCALSVRSREAGLLMLQEQTRIIRAELMNGTDIVYQGVIRPYRTLAAYGKNEDPLSLEILDYTELLHTKVASNDGKVWSNTNLRQVIEDILEDCDVETTIEAPSAISSQAITYIKANSGEFYDEILAEMLYEYGYDYRFVPNKLKVVKNHMEQGDQTPRILDIRNRLNITRSDSKDDGIEVRYNTYVARRGAGLVSHTSKEFKDAVVPGVVWSVNNHTGYYYNNSMNSSPTSAKWLKWNPTGFKMGDVVELTNLKIEKYLEGHIWYDDSNRAFINGYDLEGCAANIYYNTKFATGALSGGWNFGITVHGDIILKIEHTDSELVNGEEPKVIDARFLDSKTAAQNLARIEARRLADCALKYSFDSLTEYEAGSFYNLVDTVTGVDTTIRILSCTLNADGIYSITAEGAGDVNASVDPVSLSLIDASSDANNWTTVNAAISTEPDSLNSVTAHIEGPVLGYIDEYGLSFKWYVNDVLVPSLTGTEVTFPSASLEGGANTIKVEVYRNEDLVDEASTVIMLPGDGEDGATFTPSVDAAGNLSWTNDAGLPNPPTVNIKGPAGNGATYWGVRYEAPASANTGDYYVFGLCGNEGEEGEAELEGTVYVLASGGSWEVMDVTSAENNNKILVAYADILAKKDDTAYFSEPPTNSGTIQYAKVLMANAIIADGIKANDGFFENITATGISILGDSLFRGRIDSPALTTVNGGEGETDDIVLTQGAQLGRYDALEKWLDQRISDDGIYPIQGTYTDIIRISQYHGFDISSGNLAQGQTSSFVVPCSAMFSFNCLLGTTNTSKLHVEINKGTSSERIYDIGSSDYFRAFIQISKGSTVDLSWTPGSGTTSIHWTFGITNIKDLNIPSYYAHKYFFSNATTASEIPDNDNYTLTLNGETYDHATLYRFDGMPTSNASGPVSTAKTNIFSLVEEDGTAYSGTIKSVWWETSALAEITLANNTVVTLRPGYVRSLSATFSILKTDLYAEVTDLIPKDTTTDVGTTSKPFDKGYFNDIYIDGKPVAPTSNPNLLDNGWFTINQRAATAASGSYGVDRFTGYYTVGSNGLSLANAEYFIQPIEGSLKTELSGKVLTFSVLYSDGTIESGSAPYKSSNWVTYAETEKSIIQNTNTGFFAVTAKTNITVRAVKVEYGDKSTLAYDSIPDYATELLKCQRFFYKIPYSVYATAIKRAGTLYSEWFRFPVEMRTTPSITGSFQFIQSNGSWSSAENLYDGFTSGTINSFGVTLQKGYSGFSNYQATQIYVRDMALSADL